MQETSHTKKANAALISIAASVVMTTAKFVVAIATGSLGVLSEALHSLIDLGATVITWFAVRFADLPPDDEHHYGHARIENLAALAEAVLLMLTAFYVAYEAVLHLIISAVPFATHWWAFGLLGFGIVIDFWRSSTLKRVAAAEVSAALAADAKHFEADIYASCAVIIGLVGVALGFPIADAIAALLVSGFIFWLGFKLCSETISALLDRAPEGVTILLRQTLAQEASVLAVEHLRVRQVGRVAYVSFVAKVPRSLPTAAIADLGHKLKALVQNVLPGADVNVALEPVALDSETAQQKVLAIAALRGLSIHHLVVQHLAGKHAISFDVELPSHLSLGVAHERATVLEDDIRSGLGGRLEVESHIEPRPIETLSSVVAEKPTFKKVERALKVAVRGEKTLSDIHNIRLRRIGAELYLHYHCRFAASLSLEACHAVLDRVEARLVAKLPQVKRIVAHAEPLGHAKHKL